MVYNEAAACDLMTGRVWSWVFASASLLSSQSSTFRPLFTIRTVASPTSSSSPDNIHLFKHSTFYKRRAASSSKTAFNTLWVLPFIELREKWDSEPIGGQNVGDHAKCPQRIRSTSSSINLKSGPPPLPLPVRHLFKPNQYKLFTHGGTARAPHTNTHRSERSNDLWVC